MRLIVTVERYAPAIGGAERVAQKVSEGLAARGHEVHVITGSTPGPDTLGGVSVHRIEVAGNEARGIRGDGEEVIALVDRIAPELVFNYAAQTWATDCCAPLLGRPGGPRMVLAPCGFSGLRSRTYARYFAEMPARLRSYDALVLHSRVYQDYEFAVRAGADPVLVIPNGADPPSSDAPRPAIPSGLQLAVTVGSHVRSKGHAEFARALGALGRTRPLHGAIIGPPRSGLGAVLGCQLGCTARARLSRGRLSVIDGRPEGVVAGAVAAADLFMFTSRIECAPLVILEAMAAGTPWVSFDVGNVSELPGGIVAADRPALVAAAGEILDGRHPGLGEQGAAAWASTHRWPDVVARYEAAFEQVIAS